jgi:hypothetical protein
VQINGKCKKYINEGVCIMKKYITSFVVSLGIVGCVLLTGCQFDSKNIEKIVFEGESLNWQVVYTMEGDKQHHDSYFTIKYKGEQSDSINNVDYIIDGPTEGGDGNFILPNTKEYSDKMLLTGDMPKPSDRTIVVTIKWNGQTELMALKNNRID